MTLFWDWRVPSWDSGSGMQNGCRIPYEDAFGQEYTQEAEVATIIEEKPAPEPVEPEEDPDQNHHWWIFVLIGTTIGGGIGFGIPWYLKDRRQRQEDDLRL